MYKFLKEKKSPRMALTVIVLLLTLSACAKKDNSGGSTGGNPMQPTIPTKISIDAQ